MVKKEPAHKESWYQAKIIKWLKEQYPGAFVWKAQAGPYCRQGIPDICAIIDGHFFGFEVKRPELGRLSKIQEQTIKEINAAGGTTAVVSYPEEVERTIRTYQTVRTAAAAVHADRRLAGEVERLDQLMTSIYAVCGMNALQLQEKFLAGYTLQLPNKEGGDSGAGIP